MRHQTPCTVRLKQRRRQNVCLILLLRYPNHVLPPACIHTEMVVHSFFFFPDNNIRTDQGHQSQQLVSKWQKLGQFNKVRGSQFRSGALVVSDGVVCTSVGSVIYLHIMTVKAVSLEVFYLQSDRSSLFYSVLILTFRSQSSRDYFPTSSSWYIIIIS